MLAQWTIKTTLDGRKKAKYYCENLTFVRCHICSWVLGHPGLVYMTLSVSSVRHVSGLTAPLPSICPCKAVVEFGTILDQTSKTRIEYTDARPGL